MNIKEIKIQLALGTLNPACFKPGDIKNIKAPDILHHIYELIIMHTPTCSADCIPRYVFREFEKKHYLLTDDMGFLSSFNRSHFEKSKIP